MANEPITIRSLKNKFAHGALLNILIRFKSLIYFPILVGTLEKSEVGLVSLWFSVSALLIGLIVFNLPDSSNRLILNYSENNEPALVSQTISTIISVSTISFLVFFTMLIFYVYFFESSYLSFVTILCFLCFSKITNKLGIFLLQVFQKTKKILITQLCIEYLSLISLLFIVWTDYLLTPELVIICFIVSAVLISSVHLVKVYKEYNVEFIINKRIFKKLFMTGLFLLPSGYSMLLIQNGDFLILGYYHGTEIVGEYSFAYSLGSIVLGLSIALSGFWYSSAVLADDEELSVILTKITQFMPILLSGTVVFYYYFSPYIINLINSEYSNVLGILIVLIIGFVFNLFIQVQNGILFSRGLEKRILAISCGGLCFNTIGNLVFIPKFGIVAAALVTASTYLLMYFFQLVVIRKTLKEAYTRSLNLAVVVSILICIGVVFYLSQYYFRG